MTNMCIIYKVLFQYCSVQTGWNVLKIGTLLVETQMVWSRREIKRHSVVTRTHLISVITMNYFHREVTKMNKIIKSKRKINSPLNRRIKLQHFILLDNISKLSINGGYRPNKMYAVQNSIKYKEHRDLKRFAFP